MTAPAPPRPLRCVVVDDEAPARRRLRRLLEALPAVHVTAEAADGATAIEAVNQQRPDLVFLDIHMPGLLGIEVARRLPVQPAIVFATAYDHYAVQAFELAAVDYLLKPISRERLAETVARVRAQAVRSWVEVAESLAAHSPLRIEVQLQGKTSWVDAREIWAFHARDKYTVFEHQGHEYVIEDSLRQLEARLGDHNFIRVHRNALVQLSAVESLARVGRGGELSLRNGERIAVSRRSLVEVRECLRRLRET